MKVQSIKPQAAVPIGLQTVSLENIRDHLMRNFELDMADAEKVLDVYAGSLRENLLNLQQTLENQELQEAARQAHALKGALLNLGLAKLADTAYFLEKELAVKPENSHVELVEQLIDKLQVITDKVCSS